MLALAIAALATAALIATHPAASHPVTGAVVGVFSNPALIGNTIDGATGVPSPFNNTATASFFWDRHKFIYLGHRHFPA